MTDNHTNRPDNLGDKRNPGRVRMGVIAAIVACGGFALLAAWRDVRSQENDAAAEISEEASHEQQVEYGEYLKRALPHGIPPMARTNALQQMARMPEARLRVTSTGGENAPAAATPIQWSPLGPQPIIHGQGFGPDGYCSQTRIHASGRATAIAFGAIPATIYLGTANGGVWKTTDGGGFWTPLTDKEPSLAVGALAVIPNSDTTKDVIYVGTGEGNRGCDSEFGQGILKSINGGRSWTQLGEPKPFDRMAFARIALAPGAGKAGQDVLYAATHVGYSGSASLTGTCTFLTSISPGLFRSTDGGASWTEMSGTGGLPSPGVDPGAATDVVLDPTNSNTVYAAIVGSKTSTGGLWKSTDGGGSWTQFTPANNNFPQTAARINLDISPDGGSLWAARAASGSTFDNVYLSTDRGATWTPGGALPPVCGLVDQQNLYDVALRGDPSNFASTVVLGLVGLYRSTDRGLHWAFIGAGTHSDFHDLAINAHGIFAANDGGIFISTNNGKGWNSSVNDELSVTQFQSVALPPDSALSMMGGTQDNGTNVFTAGIGWEHGSDGDGGYTAIDPIAPNIMFTEHFNDNTTPLLSLERSTTSGSLGSFVQMAPPPGDPVSFYAPFAEDPANPDRILFGTNRIWESCDTSRNPIVCNGTSGKPPTWRDISASSQPAGLTAGCTTPFCQLSDIEIAPTNPDVVYACSGSDGTTGSKLWSTVNGRSPAPVWTDITSGLPNLVPFTSIAVSPFNPPHMLLGLSGFNASGNHVFYSSDGTSSHPTWTDISAPNPTCTAINSCFPDVPVSAVLFDRTDATEKTYLAGTDIGVFISEDAGVTWQKFSTGTLPAVPIYMLRQNSVITVAATHGRGIWTIPKTGPITPPSDSFTYTGSMNIARQEHTSTTLLDGRVLITGGIEFNGGGSRGMATAEIYDPATSSFSYTSDLITPRVGHTAALLKSGKVLILGGAPVGNGSDNLASAEIFDPAGNGGDGTFTLTGSMSTPRYGALATTLADGRVLVLGGLDQNNVAIPGAELFDPAGNGGKGSFSPAGGTPARLYQSSTLLDDGRVLIAAGIDQSNNAEPTDAYLFDPNNGPGGSSDPTGNLNFGRYGHSGTLLLNGKVLIAGGAYLNGTAELFNPTAAGGVGAFTKTAALKQNRAGHTASLLPDGRVLIAGGGYPFGAFFTGALASAELFDPAANKGVGSFTLAGNMNVARSSHRASTLNDGSILITGGSFPVPSGSGYQTEASAEIYHPSGLPAPTPTATHTAAPTPTATHTAVPSATATRTPTPTATATPKPGVPFIASIPKVVRVGSSFVLTGSGFTPGSVVNFFVALANGVINAGPLTPTARSIPTQLTVAVPTTIIDPATGKPIPMPLGDGFASVVVINTDKGFLTSNPVGTLLEGNPADGIPSITSINGAGLDSTSSDPNFAANNVSTVVKQGSTVTIGGSGFDLSGVSINLFAAGGNYGPYAVAAGSSLSSSAVKFTLPASGPKSPPTGPGSFQVVNSGSGSFKVSNAVAAVIGAQISVTKVSQLGSTVTAIGTGFSSLTVINFFNVQGKSVVNLGGLTAGGPVIPLAIVSDTRFTFTVPAGAVAGPAYVQALNPPFVPFSSSGTDPGGAFMLK